MNHCTKRSVFAVILGLCLGHVTVVSANVDLDIRPASQSVIAGDIVNVEIYAVSDSGVDQAAGWIDFVFTWDQTALELLGTSPVAPAIWNSEGFPSDAGGDGLNAPFTGLPDNDGDAWLLMLVNTPNMATPGPTGLLVTTLQFRAIDTSASAQVAIAALIGSTPTRVLDSLGGTDVTGVLGGPVTVTIDCNLSTDCDDGNDCTDDVCNNPASPTSTCSRSNSPSGATCGDPSDLACDHPDTCDGSGTCQDNLEALGTACGSPAQTECTNPDACDQFGICQPNHASFGFPCGDPAESDCDHADICDGGGVCDTRIEPADTACGDPANTECDDPDTCNGTGACLDNAIPAGIACGDPQNTFCTDPDTCDGTGACDPNDFPCAGGLFCHNGAVGPECVECLFGDDTPCDDLNFCTQDTCLPTNFCLSSPDPMDGVACVEDPVLFCNGVETCQQGACASPGTPCNDQNVCTDDSCDEVNDECINTNDDTNLPDDGIFCNGVDTCQGGAIIPGVPLDCDDGNLCSVGTCNETTQSCDQVNNDGQACEDGDVCTIDDLCISMVCSPGNPPGGNGRVDLVWAPISQVALDGGVLITIGLYAVSVDATPDSFQSISIVLNWDPMFVQLTQNIDNGPYAWSSSGFPSIQALNDTFTDGDAYYEAWTQLPCGENPPGVPLCPPPEAVPAPGLLITTFQFQTVAATPGTDITIPPCESLYGTQTNIWGGQTGRLQGNLGSANVQVVECFTATDCGEDGLFCNGVETCTNNVCGVLNPAPCDDQNVCTDDSCQEGAGQADCFNVPNDSNDPDDGLFCNGVDTCLNGAIVEGSAPDCDDQNICTDDICSEAVRLCINSNNTEPCEDNDPCTDPDTCFLGICAGTQIAGCVNCDTTPECDDLLSCTDDTCTGTNGFCIFASNDALCLDDGLFCNGTEICDPPTGDPGTGCASTGLPCPDCTEIDRCGCDAPTIARVGGRYVAVTVGPFDSDVPMAVEITYCDDGQTNISKYVGAVPAGVSAVDCGPGPGCPFDIDLDGTIDGSLGFLVDDPADALYLTPAQWNDTIYVTGIDVVPSAGDPAPPRIYEARADCGTFGSPTYSPSVIESTWVFGDVNDDGTAGFGDILDVVKGFQNDFTVATIPSLDLEPCEPNQAVNFADILVAVKGFQNNTYTGSTGCPEPCP